ncbi:cell wall hydrolase [Sphingomonas canadensis]|uniref:Cell wall hydrolase n=1 Tax=Sphingomonas canadensis TaxID=1219257 RepID=A0ABW3H5N9_9SPHN|nr:cell wall hydrolase [Sphingomonas canadensis]MCW3836418.1 cell wall hydrolase [Sphingomonas canadensis]
MFWRRFTRMQAHGLAAAAIASLIGAGFSAQALGPRTATPAPAAPAPAQPSYETDDHFPGAAQYLALDDADAFAAGMTGLVDLPEGAAPADLGADASIVPAQPFRFAGSGADRARALQCLTTAIYYEAGTEPLDGQRAVAQVILNRVRHPAFPATVCGVVFQGSEKPGCQFSFACDGAMARRPMREYWQRAERVAQAALDGGVFGPVGLATFYHTYAVTPKWNRAMVMTGTFGAHFFHRWKGGWGTAAAFTQPYRGREPAPGPHAPLAPEKAEAAALSAPAAAPPAAAPAKPAKAPETPRAQIQPAYADSGRPVGGYAAPADDPDSQILDKWKDSGKPIR